MQYRRIQHSTYSAFSIFFHFISYFYFIFFIFCLLFTIIFALLLFVAHPRVVVKVLHLFNIFILRWFFRERIVTSHKWIFILQRFNHNIKMYTFIQIYVVTRMNDKYFCSAFLVRIYDEQLLDYNNRKKIQKRAEIKWKLNELSRCHLNISFPVQLGAVDWSLGKYLYEITH